ncbi:MAG: hypothetical protein NTY99_03780 [DPANN group archaeon]|nr:hypothetical protein [DPANN group archaeon]
MPKERVLEHPVWQAVASQELLQKYANVEFKRHGLEKAMGVHIPSKSKVPVLTAISLGGAMTGSDLDGSSELSDENGYLVGKLDDRFAKEARARGLSQEVAAGMAKEFPHAQIAKSEDDDN